MPQIVFCLAGPEQGNPFSGAGFEQVRDRDLKDTPQVPLQELQGDQEDHDPSTEKGKVL